MGITTKKIANSLLIFGVFAFFSIGIFGMSQSMQMEMNDDGTMSGCLFDGRAEICLMTIAEHLSRWQGMFIAISQKTDLLTLLFSFISAIGALVVFALKKNGLLLLKHLSDRWRLYLKRNPYIPLFDPLREAFSQGILNPKIYESAIL